MKKIKPAGMLNGSLVILGLLVMTIFFTRCKKDDLIPTPPSTPASGEGMFWISSNLGCGNITVTVAGYSGVITSYYNTTIPSCTASGAATFNLSPGTYTYFASCSGGLSWSGSITIVSGGCTKIELTSAGSGGGGGGGSTTGQGMFWIASDLGCGNINVVCNGITRTITGFYGTAPSCGASGCATFDLSPGTYNFSASCTGKTWSGSITITAGACSRFQLTNTGGGSTTGQGMFWIASDMGCGNINVICNGISRTITSFYASSPSCGASGCATFDLSPGTYSYSASCTGKTWSGNIAVTAGGCSKVQFTSGGGGSTTGQAMFWTAFDRGCGNITVVCNGVSKLITSYYSSSVPSCGASGCATFDLSPGTYSYSATCSGGWSTTGTVTVTAAGCTRIQFT